MENERTPDQGHSTRPPPPRPPPPIHRQSIVTYADVKKVYNRATQTAQKGLISDEEDKNDDAIATYTQALDYINQVLAVDCIKIPGVTADEVNSVKDMQLKLSKTKMQIEYRLQALQPMPSTSSGQTTAELMEINAPPSYEEVMSSDSSSSIAHNGDAAMMALGDSIVAQEMPVRTHSTNATCVFEIPDGVQIFFITPEGYVSAPSYPSSLQVFQFLDSNNEGVSTALPQPPAFMQVNEWIYPLIPDTSPSLHTSYGAYMFPDTASPASGAAVGLILPDGLPEGTRDEFESLMRSLTVMEDQPPEVAASKSDEEILKSQLEKYTYEITEEEDKERRESSTARKISKGVLTAADWISWGVLKGAEKASKLIHSGSEKVQQHITPKSEESTIRPDLQNAAQCLRTGTHVATIISSFVVRRLGDATAALGRYIAPQVTKRGEKLLNKSGLVKDDSAKSKMDGVIEVATSGIQAFGTVYVSLESAAIQLARNIANETVQIVNLRYGNQAGHLTQNTLYSVGNVALTAHHVKNLGIKAVAKKAAKETGKAVLSDIYDRDKTPQEKRDDGSSSEDKKKPT